MRCLNALLRRIALHLLFKNLWIDLRVYLARAYTMIHSFVRSFWFYCFLVCTVHSYGFCGFLGHNSMYLIYSVHTSSLL